MLSRLVRHFTSASHGAIVFAAAIFIIYCFVPAFLYFCCGAGQYFYQLSLMALISSISIIAGYIMPILDSRFGARASRIVVNLNIFHSLVWAAFILFIIYSFATASSIPIVSVFRGASAEELSIQRGDLKARTGFDALLLYLSTLFVCALLPYSLTRMFADRMRARFVLLFLFLGYSISALHKAMFAYVLLPLIYYYSRVIKSARVILYSTLAVGVALLFFVTVLASGGTTELESGQAQAQGAEVFFSAKYRPVDVKHLLLWRSAAVPVFTAADTLEVFSEELGGNFLGGATSTLLATVLSKQRVPLEKMVFAHEWGWNDIANANSVFFIEGYVNFGWVGIIVFSLFVGQSLRWLASSQDIAMRSLWLIYCFALFSGGLIGVLLSNGYSLVFFAALFVRFSFSRTPLKT